ncbi:carotenoid biosynthesis protein [Anditalea andensis]|uniref:Carotene biosynthesis associated membrane protein n=1 Tax=Anditalea andensis TaxID=1048983 RepID=A0A074KWZ3_9BACT|nr:carotenoid biosynthesis protein [Anditalea andensis]KEO73484.1 carotene biosynthesis associated membrane protein [Anditalea andensis]
MLTRSDPSLHHTLSSHPTTFKFILTVFYVVGIIGMAIPGVRPYFQLLTPFHLILSVVILLIFHRDWSYKFIVFALVAFLIGFVAEAVGVQTGLVFGDYSYGTVLGPKIWGAPLMIGVNWFLLVYVSGALFHNYIANDYLAAFMGALLMVFLDFIIEPVAIKLEFWAWEHENIPLSNYIGWLAIAFPIQIVYRKMSFRKDNPLAVFLLVCLVAFFGILSIVL